MKFAASQVMHFVSQRRTKRSLRVLFKFFFVLGAMITAYSVLFHYVMMYEGREYSWVTGFYWTLTVMSTLGFGDITFHSDLGRLFSMVVLLSGIVFLLILLPFTIIQFLYAPWVEQQAAARTPREVPQGTQGHVILTQHDPLTATLIDRLKHVGHKYVIVVPEHDEAVRLHDMHLPVVMGDLDAPETYERLRADRAAMLATTCDDMQNTNIAFTARQQAPDLPIVATSSNPASVDILKRAGVTQVLPLAEMMGKALARCMTGGDALAHTVGNIDELLIAEASVRRTPMVGKTLRENRLRELGVSVIGLWERGQFYNATPDSLVAEDTILLLAGSDADLAEYNEHFVIYNVSAEPVVIVGGGRVGQAAARALAARHVDYRIIDLRAGCSPDPERSIVGDAGDPETLKRAGLADAPAVLIATDEDNLNIYLTIYCRSVRPDIQIITRGMLERNVETLHRAGADFVLSYASMGATTIYNLIQRGRMLTITEGLDVFRLPVPRSLDGKTIIESGVREKSDCTIVAIRGDDNVLATNPGATTTLRTGQEMVLVGSVESERRFLAQFGDG
jgi:voltage-gated potassium channel